MASKQKNAMEQSSKDDIKTAKESIKFVLRLTPEQYEVYETLAKLQGHTVHEYMHEHLISLVKAATDNIEDYEERKRADQAFENEDSTVTMERIIVIRGRYRAHHVQLAALPAIAKALKLEGPAELLQWAIFAGTCADLDHLGYFSARGEMMKQLHGREA